MLISGRFRSIRSCRVMLTAGLPTAPAASCRRFNKGTHAPRTSPQSATETWIRGKSRSQPFPARDVWQNLRFETETVEWSVQRCGVLETLVDRPAAGAGLLRVVEVTDWVAGVVAKRSPQPAGGSLSFDPSHPRRRRLCGAQGAGACGWAVNDAWPTATGEFSLVRLSLPSGVKQPHGPVDAAAEDLSGDWSVPAAVQRVTMVTGLQRIAVV